MKKLRIFLLAGVVAIFASCEETAKQDNATHDADTMVIKDNGTDNPTNTITTDTTRR